MKAIAIVGILLSSLSSFSTMLLPAGHSQCLNASLGTPYTTCEEGTSFYTADDGRCGCLSTDEIIPAKTCMVAFIRCEEGKSFSSMYQDRQMCGIHEDVYVGCGCYSTSEEMHATSLSSDRR